MHGKGKLRARQPPLNALERWLIGFLLFAYASGALAHTLPAILPVTRWITDGLLFFLNGLVLTAIYLRNRGAMLFWWLLVAYVFTFTVEALGVATGAIFGEYAYGPTMWVQWLGVPLVIALNWCMLTLAANDVTDRLAGLLAIRKEGLMYAVLAALLSAILLALYDIAIEPVAIALDYWQWGRGEIPLQNYLAWGLVAFMISLPLRLLRIRYQSRVLAVYFFAQLTFFLILLLTIS